MPDAVDHLKENGTLQWVLFAFLLLFTIFVSFNAYFYWKIGDAGGNAELSQNGAKSMAITSIIFAAIAGSLAIAVGVFAARNAKLLKKIGSAGKAGVAAVKSAAKSLGDRWENREQCIMRARKDENNEIETRSRKFGGKWNEWPESRRGRAETTATEAVWEDDAATEYQDE